jgi:hypothetical protein
MNSKIILGNREIIVKLFDAFSFNPNPEVGFFECNDSAES